MSISTVSAAECVPFTAPSPTIFQANIFEGRILFCTGGGSGICKEITGSLVSHSKLITISGSSSVASIDAPWCKCCHNWPKARSL